MKKQCTKQLVTPKDGDILVLATNRNIIYSYNANGKSYNSFHVALYKGLNGNFITHKLDNDSVVAYNAPFDFASRFEIKEFNDAINGYEKAMEPCEEEYDIIEDITDNFCDLICTKLGIDDVNIEQIMCDDISDRLLELRKEFLEKYHA